MAFGRPEESRQLVREATASKPNFTLSQFLFQERYRDPGLRQQLRNRLVAAGMPP